MPDIRAGKTQPGERRQAQLEIDLRKEELVADGSASLSAFGSAVLARWEELALPKEFTYELPRAVALLEEALIYRAERYLDRMAFWWDLRTVYDVERLLADGEALLLLPYLNQTRQEFNPWAALFGAKRAVHGPFDWDEIKDAVSNRSPDTDRAVDALAAKTEDQRPVAARIVFCRAMELVFMGRFVPEAVQSHLKSLVLPDRS